MGNFAFALSGDGGETLELDVYSVIGESFWFESVSANYVRRKLKENSKAKLIKVRVNSDGGDLFAAQSIYADLQEHPARVEVDITGVAASAATLIAMAADRIRIAEGGWFMIHDPWGQVSGSPDRIEAWAEVLRKAGANYADVYAKRSGLDRKKVVALMSDETWMTAAEAKSFGFVDEVIPAKAKAAASAGEKRALDAARRSVSRAVACGDYGNAPEALRADLALEPASEPQARVGEVVAVVMPANSEPTPAPPVPAPEPQLNLALGQRPAAEEPTMSIPKNIIQALSLTDDADEAAVTTAIAKLKASSKSVAEIEAMLGCSGAALVGRVRALQQSQTENEGLAVEIEKIKVASARRDFETLRDQGLKDKKLSGPLAKMYNDRFAKATKLDDLGVPAGDGSDVVADLTEYLAHAQRRPDIQQPPADGGTNVGAAQHSGKAFEDLKPAERLKLKRENVELYNTLREDAQARNAL